MGVENVFHTLNIKNPITYSKQNFNLREFFYRIVILEIELILHEVMFKNVLPHKLYLFFLL